MESWLLRISCKVSKAFGLHLLCKKPKVVMIPWIFQNLNLFFKYLPTPLQIICHEMRCCFHLIPFQVGSAFSFGELLLGHRINLFGKQHALCVGQNALFGSILSYLLLLAGKVSSLTLSISVAELDISYIMICLKNSQSKVPNQINS